MIRKRLLSIDGGGIRGILPLTLLADLERRTGRATREHFDFLAGTSSGAVSVSGLAAGIPAERVAALYRERATKIFRRMPIVSTLQRVVTGSMYDVEQLHETILDELPPDAREWTLNDVPVDVLITAKRLSDGAPWYFVRDSPANSGRVGRYRLADAVTASAAAPTYFPPWRIEGIGELVDGGIGVTGNPVYQACVEAFLYADGYDPATTLIVSLGTGSYPNRERPGWLWPWLGWLLSELLRSPAEQQTELVRRHYSETPLHRFDVDLPRPIGLDDVAGMDELQRMGEEMARTIDWEALLSA